MNYLKITNAGVMDTRNLHMMGLSSKAGDKSKIGQWGSGLKYALAWLLRNNIGFKLFVGEREVCISRRMEEIGGIEHPMIDIDGHPTDICVNLGFDWTAWEAIREVYSNGKDEPDFRADGWFDGEPAGTDGFTSWFIPTENMEIYKVVRNWESYFDDTRTLVQSINVGTIEVRILEKKGESLSIFKNGISVFRDPKTPSVFDYDIPSVKINEKRMVEDTYAARQTIARAVMLASEATITYLLHELQVIEDDGGEECFEKNLDFDYLGTNPNEEWEKVIASNTIMADGEYKLWKEQMEGQKVLVVSDNMFRRLKNYSKDNRLGYGRGGYYNTSTKAAAMPISASATFENILDGAAKRLRRMLPKGNWAKDYHVGKMHNSKNMWIVGDNDIVWVSDAMQDMPFTEARDLMMKCIIECELKGEFGKLSALVIKMLTSNSKGND